MTRRATRRPRPHSLSRETREQFAEKVAETAKPDAEEKPAPKQESAPPPKKGKS